MSIFTPIQPSTEVTFVHQDDRNEILRINAVLERPWHRDVLSIAIADCLTFGLIAHRRGVTVGFAFYRQQMEHITLHHLATHPGTRRLGVAAALLREIQGSLPGRRPEITAVVPDHALPAHLLFHKLGFRASGTVRGHFGDADGYVFYWPGEPAAAIGYRSRPEAT